MITFETKEPFGGYQLQEDTQDFNWDEIKRKFLKVKREPGIYMYHKHAGRPSYKLFRVQSEGTFELVEPVEDGIKWIMFKEPNIPEVTMIMVRLLLLMNKKIYDHIKEDAKKVLDTYELITAFGKNSDKHRIWQSKWKTELFGNVSLNYHPFISNRPKNLEDAINQFRPKIAVEFHADYPKISTDVGIISPTEQQTGTILGRLKSPLEDTLFSLGYSLEKTKMSSTKEDDDKDSKYDDASSTGKLIPSEVNEFATAVRDRSAGTQGGWATSSAELTSK